MHAGSRDQQVKLWEVDTHEHAPKANTQPLYSVLPLRVSLSYFILQDVTTQLILAWCLAAHESLARN